MDQNFWSRNGNKWDWLRSGERKNVREHSNARVRAFSGFLPVGRENYINFHSLLHCREQGFPCIFILNKLRVYGRINGSWDTPLLSLYCNFVGTKQKEAINVTNGAAILYYLFCVSEEKLCSSKRKNQRRKISWVKSSQRLYWMLNSYPPLFRKLSKLPLFIGLLVCVTHKKIKIANGKT